MVHSSYTGIMERTWKLRYSILGLFRDNGKEDGSCYIVSWGYIGDNGQENGRYYVRLELGTKP